MRFLKQGESESDHAYRQRVERAATILILGIGIASLVFGGLYAIWFDWKLGLKIAGSVLLLFAALLAIAWLVSID
jgi:hypothetical protein